MSTWQLFSAAGNTFRWKISEEKPEEPIGNSSVVALQPSQPPQCLPSLADLLLQGSRVIEAHNGSSDNFPNFLTGLGKPVTVKQSSLSRALAILGDEGGGEEEEEFRNKGRSRFVNEVPCSFNNSEGPLFRTGLGKSVAVNQSSLARALAILGDAGDEITQTGQQTKEENGLGFPDTTSWFGSGKPFRISKSKYQAGQDSSNSTPHSLIQTASGRRVRLSSEGLLRAKTLLGAEVSGDNENFEYLQEGKWSTSCMPIGVESELPFQVEQGGTNTSPSGDTVFEIFPLDNKLNSLRYGYDSKEINDFLQTSAKSPPIKFQTAGGRSISVSSDALQRARSLLGNEELATFSSEGNAADQVPLLLPDKKSRKTSSKKEKTPDTPNLHQRKLNGQSLSKNFTSPFRSYSCQQQFPVRQGNVAKGINLIKKFDAETRDCENGHHNSFPSKENTSNRKSLTVMPDIPGNGSTSRSNSADRPPRVPLTDISNENFVGSTNIRLNSGEKRRIGRSTVSPFKRPRSSKFVTPLSKSNSYISEGSSTLASRETIYKGRVSTRYPLQSGRLYMKDYIGEPPSCKSKAENLPVQISRMNPDVAEKYMFSDDHGSGCIGTESIYHMLIQSGVSQQYVSREWVANHYKWIVWKLASYERCYPGKFCGKLLSVSNVLEELKYRYEKEVNLGHRSTIKRILEGDSPPSTRMVLCISSIFPNSESKVGHLPVASKGSETERGSVARVELTDGWYSVVATLDVLLSRKLAAGKLFVGQKLTIWGAGLCGWVGPISPLEPSKTSTLLLHINGTYRAHWADRLGFCKVNGLPLAFRSIKSNGGVVPSTLVGIMRIYPVLYRERLSDGSVIVRSERTQAQMSQLYNQRRSVVVEGIMSEFQRENFDIVDDNGCDEGAKLLKILEKAAEPEMIMAEMTSEQLTSFASYKAKLEAARQYNMQISLEKALDAAGLSGREITPFMRVRVIGLTSKRFPRKCTPKMGLITIWNPTEKQQLELIEGRAYVVSWLTPSTSDSSTFHMQTKGSSTKWLSLSPTATECFQPFFSPRKSMLLSNLGEVSLSSEFDIAAYVVYVGDVYATARQKKQWVFVTDGSVHELYTREPLESLLAISFCVPSCESDMFVPVNSNLAGSTVGFCNLIKRAKDQTNNVWVAEATESSTHSLAFDQSYFSHLKDAAALTQKWGNMSSLKIETLKRRVVSIISNSDAQTLKKL